MNPDDSILPLLRKALGRDARDLELCIHRIRQLLGRIPATPGRSEADDLPEEPDEADALRSDLQCVLADHLEPAWRALHAAARAADPLPEKPPC